MQRKVIVYFICLLFPFSVFSQLVVSADSVANTLAQTITGNGVIVSNATINCAGRATGNFNYTGANLGLTSGIILSTGIADSAVYNAANFGMPPSTAFNTTFTDPNLTAIEPQAVNDVCIVAFDFVPICNSLSITFVFASSEYDGFVCQFNDAFGIFLSGPNPGGGNYTAQNIATLPNGTPVSINNVNNGNSFAGNCPPTNSNYFVDNLTAPNMQIAYPGYTIPITSITPVTPCSTYHMEIAIADAVDWSYDSAVFIEGNSVACQNTPTVTANTTPTGCGGNTGTAAVTVTNYTGAVTYQWQPGGQTTSSINNLSAGTYTCVVGLNLSCGVISQTVTAVVANTGSTLSLTTTQQNPLCNNGTNGTATVNITGGTAPFTTSWNSAPVQTTTTATNLSSGTYVVTVHDNGGCVQTATVTLTNPAPMQTSVGTTPSTCTGSNGTATATVLSGGTAPYTYAWSTAPIQTTQTASNLNPATYTVLITDANSCTVTAVGTVTQLNGGWTLTVQAPTNELCFGGNNGAASVTINNPGANTFNYLWNSNPNQPTQNAVNLAAGSYTCTVSDNNGCTQTATVTITQPSQLVANTFVSPTTCTASIGTATVTAAGGTGPYTYSWNSNPVQTANTANHLSQTNYMVTVTDANSCTITATANIGMITQNINITATSTTSKCGTPSGGVNVSSVVGGTGPYVYSWSSNPVQTTQSLVNVVNGNYTLSITDANGCTGQYPETVGLTIGLPLTSNTSPDICNSGIGSASAIPNGTSPYQYVWNTNPQQTTQTINNLVVGNYSCTVTDALGCKDSIVAAVTNKNDILNAAFSIFPPNEIYANDAVTINMIPNTGWVLDSGFLSTGVNITQQSLNYIFTQYGTYYATYYFTSVHGCKDSLIEPIKVNDYMTLYIPSAFSPNGDGLNDYFGAQGTLINSFQMYIYDRWGKLVTTLDDITKTWNGTYQGGDAQIDVYVYKGTATDVFGKQVTFQGQINLIR